MKPVLIILAAGRGDRLRPLTDTHPKCLVELDGRSLLEWQLDAAAEAGIGEIVVVGGYRAEQLRRFDVTMVENPAYETTNMVSSLFCAQRFFGEACVVSYGDIVYHAGVLRALLDCSDPIAVVVDRQWRSYWEQRFDDPLSDAESLQVDRSGCLRSIGQRPASLEQIEAQYIGLLAFRGSGIAALRACYAAAQREAQNGLTPFGGTQPLERLFMTDLLQGMIDDGSAITAVPIEGEWLEIDSLRDLELAKRLVASGRLTRPVMPATR